MASSGTALTVEQVRLLRRFSKQMTMLFDGDPAGLRAAIRGVDIVLGEGLDVKVAVLPDGEDPDTFAKRLGKEALMAWLDQNSLDFIRFKIDLLQEEAAGDPVKRAEMVRSVVQSIAQVPDENEGPSRWNEPSFRIGLEERLLLAAAVALAEAVDLSVGVELAHLRRARLEGGSEDVGTRVILAIKAMRSGRVCWVCRTAPDDVWCREEPACLFVVDGCGREVGRVPLIRHPACMRRIDGRAGALGSHTPTS